jgi:hypothetical protein
MYQIEDLQALYLQAAQFKAQNIDVSDLSDFQAKGFATGSVGAALSLDNTRLFNEAFPQYAASLGINSQLAASGLQPQYPATPSLLTLTANGLVSGYTYVAPVGTILTAPNNQTYTVIASNYGQQDVSLTSTANVFYVISTNTGITSSQLISTILTLTPPIVSTDLTQSFGTATVTIVQNGTDQESLSDATSRLINVKQTPLCGSRSTDIQKEVINPSIGIIDAVVLTNNQLKYSTANQYNSGVYLISGTGISDYILNQGLVTGTTEVVFDRSVSSGSITTTQQKLVAQNIIGVRPLVNTVQTQGISDSNSSSNPYLKIIVTLQNGYSLSSQITLNNNIFTVQQLIQRETRRAVCQQPYGATQSVNVSTGEITNSVLLISAIEQQLDSALGSSNSTGTLGAYLVTRTVYVLSSDGVTYTQPSSIQLTLGIPVLFTDELEWIYDINTTVGDIYSNIGVNLS